MAKKNKNSHISYEIGDFSDLSIAEIIILQILSKTLEPRIRYDLYLNVNSILQSNHKISTSSFYNSLSKLEKRGFIESISNDSVKTLFVKDTPLAFKAVNVVYQYLLRNSVINDTEYVGDLAAKVLEKIGQTHFETFLAVEFYEFLDIKVVEYLTSLADELFILSTKETYDDLLKIGLKDLNFSEVYNKMIREPNDVFDFAALSEYIREPDFYGMTRIDILKEVYRVTKPECPVVIVARAELPKTDHLIADELLKLYGETVSIRTFTIEELKNDFIDSGFPEFEFFNYYGMLVGIGWVS